MIRLIFALILLAAPALALDPERREVTVISGRLWEGYQYTEMFLPSDNQVLTVMAGQDSAVTFVRTQEYYWPLSRQVYVDFERQRDPVSGVLQIEQDGKAIAEIAEEPYAIVYPEGAVNGNASLLWGAAADQGYADYQVGERDANRRFIEAQRARSAYEQALLEAARAGSKTVVPAPPPLPEPSLRLVTQPVPGFRIALASGDYQMRLMADGVEVPGTARELRVISAEGQEGLVADVLPEERWTRPLPANADSARLYARAGSTLYLTLAEATRFDEADYLSIVSPQAVVAAGRELWVRRKPATVTELEMRTATGIHRIPLSGLKVEQTSASGFGYIVRPATKDETPDIEAFPVAVPADGTGRIELAVAGFDFSRGVIAVGARNSVLSLTLALLPLVAFGLGRLLRRRSRLIV